MISFSKGMRAALLFANLGHTIVTGIVNNPSETANMAHSVKDTDGVYFVPAFSGLQVNMIYWRDFSRFS